MAWLQTKLVFRDRVKILTLGRMDMVEKFADLLELAQREDKPEIVEVALRAVIEKERPELTACSLWFMDFDYNRRCWNFGVIHPSFDVKEWGEEIPKEELLRQAELASVG